LISKIKDFFFLFLLLHLYVFLSIVLDSYEIEDISEKGMFDFAIHGRR